jgi:serine/threonine-protein kinase
MMAHQFKQPTPIREAAPGVPEGVVTVIDRLLQKAPDARYPQVDDVVEALQPYAVLPTRAGSRFGSQPGQWPSGSNHGSRFPTAPAPVASTRIPGASAQVPTPPTGPLTPVPGPPIAPSNAGFSKTGLSHSGSGPSSHVFGPDAEPARPARPGIPTVRPPQVTRASVGRLPTAPVSQSQVPTAVEPVVPLATPADSNGPVPFAEPAGRVMRLDQGQPAGMSLLVKTLIFVVVVVGVYVIGKTILFQS